MNRADRIANALAFLRRLIAAGWEFPDAECKAVEKFSLSQSEMRDMRADYDKGE